MTLFDCGPGLPCFDGDLRAVRGAGQYVKRPAFGTQFDALARKAALAAPSAVAR